MEGKLIIVADRDVTWRVALCRVVRETPKQFHIEILRPTNYWATPVLIRDDPEFGFFVNKNDVAAVDVTESDFELFTSNMG